MTKTLRWPLAAAAMALALGARAAILTVEASATRSPGSLDSQIEAKVKAFGRAAARLTERSRFAQGDRRVFSLPVKVILTQKGSPLPMAKAPQGRAPGDITLQFEAAGERSFPAAYRSLLESVLTQARPAMNALFGQPKTGGVIKVLNYDSDIQDRYAVAGGYYVPNAPGGPEIRFPVYNSSVSASINFIHCLLLSYQADSSYFREAWNEGLVRAAVMGVARTPGSLPGAPGADEVEQTLDSLYDISEGYDWNNQPGLASHPFIAPNLLNLPLPAGGSTGGPYLLRYQMAGTAWAKVQAEHPGFIPELNRRFYLSPAAYADEAALAALAQTSLNTAAGVPSATVEGLSFAEWLERQFILDPTPAPGLRTVLQAFPIAPESGSSDFGVFGIILHATRLLPTGDEVLLSGRSYPVYWRPDGFRFFTSSQDDLLEVAGGFAGVAPNFPQSTFDGQYYRVAVEAPFLNQVARTMLPAGAVATGANPSSRSVFGVLAGFAAPGAGAFYRVRIEWVGGSQDIVVNNMAFGSAIVDEGFQRAQAITARVFLVSGSTVTEVANRRVAKGAGRIGLILRPASAFSSYTLPLTARLSLQGLPLQPWRPEASSLLGISSAQLLAAQWNPRFARWDAYPAESSFFSGLGFALRPPTAASRVVRGLLNEGTPTSASLQPGWNLVSSPFTGAVPTSRVQAAAESEFFGSYTESVGTILGPTLFGWSQDPDNPDAGTFQPVTQFSPGAGVWVKCLRASGAALAFQPAPIAASTRTSSRTAPSQWWQVRLTVTSPRSHQAWVEAGQAIGATRGVDSWTDTDLPPSGGGLQVRLSSPGAAFRDVRPLGPSDRWEVRIEGLKPGAFYQFSAEVTASGRWTAPSSFRLQDPSRGAAWAFGSGGRQITFRASAPTHQFILTSEASK